MDPRFSSYEFSKHFINLGYLGVWPVEVNLSPFVKKLHAVIRLLFLGILILSMTLELVDLYLVFGNFRKVTFNLCTSVIVVGYPVKLLIMYKRRKYIFWMRLSLWRDSLRLTTPEEIAVKNKTYKEFMHIRYWFYFAYCVFLPVLAITSYYSYLWGPRELPFAAYLPIPDPMNDSNYLPGLFLEMVCGYYLIILITECEFAMYSLILQINIFYEVLICDIQKMNDLYGDDNDVDDNEFGWKKNETHREINYHLKKAKTADWLKKCVIRHLELIEYSKTFELIYSPWMLLQFSLGAFLIIMNCFELSLYLHELNARFCFQVGFLTGILADFLVSCTYLSKLSSQCNDVGKAAYTTNWYKMDPETRKKFNTVITCSKRAPKITAGKLFQIDMPLLLSLARLTYSWVMLMRQLMVKESVSTENPISSFVT